MRPSEIKAQIITFGAATLPCFCTLCRAIFIYYGWKRNGEQDETNSIKIGFCMLIMEAVGIYVELIKIF